MAEIHSDTVTIRQLEGHRQSHGICNKSLCLDLSLHLLLHSQSPGLVIYFSKQLHFFPLLTFYQIDALL